MNAPPTNKRPFDYALTEGRLTGYPGYKSGLTYGDGYKAAVEDCAKFVEQHQETVTETPTGSDRTLSPRRIGNQIGLGYVAGIRGLAK